MRRLVPTCAALLAVALPACLHAGALLWQVTGFEKGLAHYQMANLQRRIFTDKAPEAVSVWPMEAVAFSATSAGVIQWDLWHCLQDWLVGTGRVDSGESVRPTYRDLVTSGFISVNLIEMPEMRDNVEL